MRVLIATDFSTHADLARRLLAALALPKGSTVDALTVLGMPDLVGFSKPTRELMLARHSRRAHTELETWAGPLRARGLGVRTHVRFGRPATVITREAARRRSDLLVVGSRGRGVIAAAVLGSVAAEVVDAAPCPVLVARVGAVERAVFAEDGSPPARAARRMLEAIGGSADVTVLSVVRAQRYLAVGVAPSMMSTARRMLARERVRERAEHTRLAEHAAERLQAAGLSARAFVRSGDPAAAILDLERELGADLIALGTRGRSRVDLLGLGSVARNVLLHAPCSVLVAPRPRAR